MKKWLYYITILLSCLIAAPLLTAPAKIIGIPYDKNKIVTDTLIAKSNELLIKDLYSRIRLEYIIKGKNFSGSDINTAIRKEANN